jgi:hypothetical protein
MLTRGNLCLRIVIKHSHGHFILVFPSVSAMCSAADFDGCVTRLAVRFDPPVVAFEYRPSPGARRLVFEVSLPELSAASSPCLEGPRAKRSGPSGAFGPQRRCPPEGKVSAEALLARSLPWPFSVRRISVPQLDRLLGRIRQHWEAPQDGRPMSGSDGERFLREAELRRTPPPPGRPTSGAKWADRTPSAAKVSRVYRVSTLRRFRAERRYAHAKDLGRARYRYGKPAASIEDDLRLSASVGLVTQLWGQAEAESGVLESSVFDL